MSNTEQPSTNQWRLIDSGHLGPAANMALDEALFASSSHVPTLRFYGWNPAAVSLGYFQKFEDFHPEPARSLGAVIVRRSTGGGAILHDDELTYSVSGDLSRMPFVSDSVELYHRFHDVIIDALGALGVSARKKENAILASDDGPDKFCFAHSSSMDVVVDGRKLAGSAQRKRGSRVLMHGSVFLGPNRMVPLAASVGEAAGSKVSYEEFAALFRTSAEKVLGVRLEEGGFTAWEKENAKKIEAAKYGSDSWTRKR